MKTPERLSALRAAKITLLSRDQKIFRRKQRLELFTSARGVGIDQEVHEEIAEVIKDKIKEIQSLLASDFRRGSTGRFPFLTFIFRHISNKLGDCYES